MKSGGMETRRRPENWNCVDSKLVVPKWDAQRLGLASAMAPKKGLEGTVFLSGVCGTRDSCRITSGSSSISALELFRKTKFRVSRRNDV
jgi:hypothetical protein